MLDSVCKQKKNGGGVDIDFWRDEGMGNMNRPSLVYGDNSSDSFTFGFNDSFINITN